MGITFGTHTVSSMDLSLRTAVEWVANNGDCLRKGTALVDENGYFECLNTNFYFRSWLSFELAKWWGHKGILNVFSLSLRQRSAHLGIHCSNSVTLQSPSSVHLGVSRRCPWRHRWHVLYMVFFFRPVISWLVVLCGLTYCHHRYTSSL